MIRSQPQPQQQQQQVQRAAAAATATVYNLVSPPEGMTLDMSRAWNSPLDGFKNKNNITKESSNIVRYNICHILHQQGWPHKDKTAIIPKSGRTLHHWEAKHNRKIALAATNQKIQQQRQEIREAKGDCYKRKSCKRKSCTTTAPTSTTTSTPVSSTTTTTPHPNLTAAENTLIQEAKRKKREKAQEYKVKMILPRL